KGTPEAAPVNPLLDVFKQKYYAEFRQRKLTSGKHERATSIRELRDKIYAEVLPENGEAKYTPEQAAKAFEWLEERVVRDLILEGQRIDGRNTKQIRAISCEVGVLPRTHGSAIFVRGETQALVTTTLGTTSDEQRVDGLGEEYSKKFMLDYNFPPFSVGECRPIRGPGRREIGHGALAEHFGDMDFKVAGTGRGVTGIQLDLKIDGINEEIIRAALDQAREARFEILKTMLTTLRQPRGAISDFAPRLIQIRINPEKIGLLIGPGGKTTKGIQEATGAKTDIDAHG